MMARVAMVPWSRRLAVALLAASLVLLPACETVFTRGILLDAAGQPVGGASVRVTAVESGKLVAEAQSDTSGCFNLHQFPPDDGRRFLLDVSLAGYKPVSFTFDLHALVVEGTLAADSSSKESTLVRLTNGQIYGRWEQTCAPPSPVGN
jgi:Carboxypeptidase regulatory-like domain